LDNGSRINREVYARFCESLRVKLPGSTHPYIRVKGEWRYLYRAVDKDGNTIDFLLRAHRDKTAARRYFEKSIAQNGVPETVTIDKSGANLAALEAINDDRETPIKIRQSKYLNNLVEVRHEVAYRSCSPFSPH
jgi:putative transposase